MSYHDFVFCLPIDLIKKIIILNNKCALIGLVIYHILILVNCFESLQIPDQQAQIGKLFYYKISPLQNVKNIKINEAGDNKLPDWLYFNENSYEIVGIPLNKGLHFIEVQIESNDGKQTRDIFALDIIDVPIAYNKFSDGQCLLRIKEKFNKIIDVWRIVSYLSPVYPPDENNNQEFENWLERVKLTKNYILNEYSIEIEEHLCNNNKNNKNNKNDLSFEKDDKTSEIENKLKKLGLHSEVINISRNSISETDLYNEMLVSTESRGDILTGTKNYHYRRDLGDKIHGTPVLAPDWMTLTTSTIVSATSEGHDSVTDPLSRMLIPSMTSPTVDAQHTQRLYSSQPDHHSQSLSSSFHNKYHTTFIYSTPIIAPEMPTIISGHQDLLTPTPVLTLSPTTFTQQTSSAMSPSYIAPSPSVIPDIVSERVDTTSQVPTIDTDKESTTTTTTTTTTSTTTTQSSISNKSPYINKRLRKLELIAGKFWKFTIPADTFVDFEEGDTRKLKLTFLLSSPPSQGQPPPHDYWIQFDHENQYLYALPVENDVGKHVFDLVAVDSSGAHVTETLEIHVRQNKLTRAFTHSFTLYNVQWDSFQFAFIIDAVSTLLRKIATRVYGDGSIHAMAVQEISHNEKENKWIISWTNDTLPTHPCPRDAIQQLYVKLHHFDSKIHDDSLNEPSRILKQTIRPDFQVERVKMKFIHKSACGNYDMPYPTEIDKKKVNPIVRNRIGRLGPFKIGQVFKYKVPEDTFFSEARDVSTRELSLTLRAIDPPVVPDFLQFDPIEQEFYGVALNPEQVRSYELNLIAEDRIVGDARANDIFTIEIISQPKESLHQYTFELFINLLAPIGRDDISMRERVDVVSRIATKVFSDGDTNAIHLLSIRKFLFDGISSINSIDDNDIETDNDVDDKPNKRTRRHKHQLSQIIKRHRRNEPSQMNQIYLEFRWTNRTIISHDTCPKELIMSNIVNRIFKPNSLERLRGIFEPNFDIINVVFIPIGTCKNVLIQKETGNKPIPKTSPVTSTSHPTTVMTTTKSDVFDTNQIEHDDSEFVLTTIIPPVAIFIALIFAAIVGCCFHRANRKRKSVEISRLPNDPINPEREVFLQKGRTPIIFEFEQQQQQQQQYLSSQQPSLISPVIMPPTQQQQPQQMTPLRQLGKPTYQPLSQGSQQIRRQPPPYYK